MARRILGILLIPILLGTPARAQNIGAGSTVAGDYLRGVGIEAAGMGQFNLHTAQANSINTDTAIRWNEYVDACVKNGSRELAAPARRTERRRRKNTTKPTSATSRARRSSMS